MARRPNAFTIIELLTVIAILALLMAILFPTLSKARQQAKKSACLSTLKGIGNGTVIYLNENRDVFYPVRMVTVDPSLPAGDYNAWFVNSYGRERPRWQWFIETETGPPINPAPFHLVVTTPPFRFGDETGGGGIDTMSMTNDVFLCPALDDPLYERSIRDGAFGYNYQYLGNTRTDRRMGRWDNFAVGLHQIPSASQTVLIADSRGAGLNHGQQSFMLDPPRLAVERDAMRYGPEIAGGPMDRFSPAEPRHGGLVNTVFVDAHAESMQLSELGYEVKDKAEGEMFPGFRTGDPIPVLTPDQEVYQATNKLWNGKGIDPMAKQSPGVPAP